MFFGECGWFIVNYATDKATRYSLGGEPPEVLQKPTGSEPLRLFLGRIPVSPAVATRLIGGI
jgi:hypothetical protein